jgi:hypothetical protein
MRKIRLAYSVSFGGWKLNMNRISKNLSLALVLMIVAITCFPVTSVYAQSTKPSPPEFTAQMPNENTIELAIKNQAFTNSSSINAIVYYYRVKDHNTNQWIICGNYQLQSDSQTTLITIPPHPDDLRHYLFPPNWPNTSNLVDFQVEAVSGYYLVKYVQGQMPGAPLQTNGYSEITFNKSETSDWSSIQTVDISKGTASTSPNPTANEQPTAMITPSPTPAFAPASATIEASTENGDTINLGINGNITSEQMSKPTITTNQSQNSTTISFNLTGQNGAVGLGNLTIPKNAIPYQTAPAVYIDGQQIENQGYTQDADNYYVWYTTHFSTHQISIVFAQSVLIPEFPAVLLAMAFLSMVTAAVTLFRRGKAKHGQN